MFLIRLAPVCLLALTVLPAHASERDARRPISVEEYTDRAATLDEMARRKRLEEIAFARELLSGSRLKGEDRALVMLRLGDLLFAEGRHLRQQEDARYLRDVDACLDDTSERGCDGVTADYSGSAAAHGQSVKVYERLLSGYPTFSRADEAAYYLGQAYWSLDQRAAAVEAYTRLARSYPDSTWTPKAYLMVGEHYFDSEDLYKALVAYKKATTTDDPEVLDLALYKLGWCYYNVGEYKLATLSLRRVVQRAMSGAAVGFPLQDEALNDLVRFYADSGEIQDGVAFFSSLGRPDLARRMTTRLARALNEQGEVESAVRLLQQVIAGAPDAPDAALHQAEIVAMLATADRREALLVELSRYQRSYGPGSAWWQRQDAAARSAPLEELEAVVRGIAARVHEEARKQGPSGTASYRSAERLYAAHAAMFPEHERSYDVRFGEAELLYEIGRYGEAHAAYSAVLAMAPEGRHAEFCARAAIHAADKLVGEQPGDSPGDSPVEATALTEWEAAKVAAIDVYVARWPDGEDTLNMLYESGYLLYHRNHFGPAADRFRAVIRRAPATPEAELAAELILDSLALAEDWEKLEEVAWAFYLQEGLGRSQRFKADTLAVYQSAHLKLGEAEVAAGDLEAAAARYAAFAAAWPASERADLALNNAAAHYAELGLLAEAMAARAALIEGHPRSDYRPDAMAALAYDRETVADFAGAAALYERLFDGYPQHRDAADALYSAGVFREALGDTDAALRDLQRHLAAWPDDERAVAITLSVGRLYEASGQPARAGRVYRRMIGDEASGSLEERAFARLRYGRTLEAEGREAEAAAHFQASVAWADEVGALSTEPAAEMRYALGAASVATYEAIALDTPPPGASPAARDRAATERTLARGRALQAVRDDTLAVLETGSGQWGLAALVRLAEAHEGMAAAFRGAHVPTHLTPQQAEYYRMRLEDEAYKQEQQAAETYAAALGRAYELDLFNEATARANERLTRLRPDDFPPSYELLPAPDYASASSKDRLPESER